LGDKHIITFHVKYDLLHYGFDTKIVWDFYVELMNMLLDMKVTM